MSLTFNQVVTACPAAATEGKVRRTTGSDYIALETRGLFNKARAAGFACVKAWQGPSFKRQYVPFARHAMEFAPRDGDPEKSGFRLVITNSHDGLTPLMFIPAYYCADFKATLYASSFSVFHREFSVEGGFRKPVDKAFAMACAARPAVESLWRKMRGITPTDSQVRRYVAEVLHVHGGTTANIPLSEVLKHADGMEMTLATLAAATLGGYLHAAFTARTPGGDPRKVYAPRAIVRTERAAFGAWYEACGILTRNGVPVTLAPFNATPVARGKDGTGERRKSGAVILTDKPETLAAV